MDAVFLAGRILFALVFVMSGLTAHLANRAQSVQYVRAYNAPAPELLVPLSGIAIVVGGLSIAFGVLADVGALIVAAFVLSVAPIMHAFWKEADPQMQQNQMAHFLKNLAIAGGALVIFFTYNQLQGDAPLSITDPLFDRG
jgi:putative oxidoreductase